MFSRSLVLFSLLVLGVTAFLNATEDSEELILANDRLVAAVKKSTGGIYYLTLDGQNLLGTLSYVEPTPGGATGSGNSGIGPYLDCYCIPSGSYTPGSIDPKYELISGIDSTGTKYGGIVMNETYPPTGQTLYQYWFLREGETGLHTFSRLAYYNKTTPFLRNLQEFRTLFRPNTPLWTHLLTNEDQYSPLPSANAISKEVVVQDATWSYAATPDDPYVVQEGTYFTKYIYADTWRDHDVHGMYSDGTTSVNNYTFGSWLVQNTKDTYFGGPLHSDLVVDGIVYNYIVSNHHGDGTPNITDGFDRTFGPQYYFFNKGEPGTSMFELRDEALEFYSPTWNQAFYDSIAQHIPNYVPSSNRTTFNAKVKLPAGAIKPLAVLAQNGVDFQDNVLDTTAYQYWGDIDSSGSVSIPAVKAGTYRLTIYAEGIFGQYTQDDVEVVAGKVYTLNVDWTEESCGTELWRIGTPDKSAGEFKHGYALDPNHTLHPAQYRSYWPVHDFPTDFPEGVRFEVGKSDPAEDFNYIHWSVFGGYANVLRPEPYYENVNNWTILFDLETQDYARSKQATFTIQLAGAKTAAGNTDLFNSTQLYNNLPFTVVINGYELPAWVIPYYHSSSCGVRSGIICYNVANKFTFDTSYFVQGTNEFVLSLPANATDYESAVLPTSVYVQYDALRLEVD